MIDDCMQGFGHARLLARFAWRRRCRGRGLCRHLRCFPAPRRGDLDIGIREGCVARKVAERAPLDAALACSPSHDDKSPGCSHSLPQAGTKSAFVEPLPRVWSRSRTSAAYRRYARSAEIFFIHNPAAGCAWLCPSARGGGRAARRAAGIASCPVLVAPRRGAPLALLHAPSSSRRRAVAPLALLHAPSSSRRRAVAPPRRGESVKCESASFG
jgi:hypothetical protein